MGRGLQAVLQKRITHDAPLKEKFWEALELFSDDPFSASLKTHKLTGKLSGCWAFSVDLDCRVVFMFVKGHKQVLLLDIGSHAEVY